MKPDVDFVLRVGGQTLLTQVMPQIEGSHFQGATFLISVLLQAAAQEYERGADRRMKDIQEMRGLLTQALPMLQGQPLQPAVQSVLAQRECSLLISELDRVHSALSAVLIQMQAWLEERSDAPALALEAAVLDHLVASAQRAELKMA